MINKIKKIEEKLDVVEAHLEATEKKLQKVKEHTEFGKRLLAALKASPE